MGIDNVSKIIPTIQGLIAPVFDVAYVIQSEKGDVNIIKHMVIMMGFGVHLFV